LFFLQERADGWEVVVVLRLGRWWLMEREVEWSSLWWVLEFRTVVEEVHFEPEVA
jgi:hypothetical protein